MLGEVTQALEVGGGWGLAALALVVIGYLYRVNSKLRDKLSEWQGEQYDALLEMMKDKIEADLKTEAGYEKLHELLDKQIRQCELVSNLLDKIVRQEEWAEKQLNEILMLLRK